MNATNAPKPSNGPSPRGKKGGRLATYLGVLVGLLVSLIFLLPLCRTSGQEFSPAGFQTRQFYLYRIPGTDLQWMPTYQNAMVNNTPTEVLKDLKTFASNATWHMLSADSPGGESFPANLLFKAILRRDAEDNLYWGVWSTEHPRRAATLWPIIQSMAMSNLYHETPEVLRFAEGYRGPEGDFAHELLKSVHEQLQQRKDRFGLTGSDIPTGKQGESEGIVDWGQVLQWLEDHPILDKNP